MSETLELLKSAMADVASAPKVKTKGGKMYTQVVTRVEMLRKWFGFALSITTEIVAIDERVVIVKASVSDAEGRVLATGYAEEMRGGSGVNSTSALENGETSAVGRALAALGLGGGEYASADELAVALQSQRAHQYAEQQRAFNEAEHQQREAENAAQQKEEQRRQRLLEAVHKHQATITAIKEGIASGDYGSACEAWCELTDEEKQSIWVAPTKGGPFTTEERKVMQTKEFREAYFGASEQTNQEATA